MKRLAAVFAAIFVLAILVAVCAPFFIDVNRYKDRVEGSHLERPETIKKVGGPPGLRSVRKLTRTAVRDLGISEPC